jgi:hypothetical protein
MTRVAIDRGVRAYQREAIHVLVDLLDRNVPAFHRMALFAVGSHLGFVNVCVAL